MRKEVLTPTESRQAVVTGRVLRVLLTSLILAVVIGAVLYYEFLKTSPPM